MTYICLLLTSAMLLWIDKKDLEEEARMRGTEFIIKYVIRKKSIYLKKIPVKSSNRFAKLQTKPMLRGAWVA